MQQHLAGRGLVPAVGGGDVRDEPRLHAPDRGQFGQQRQPADRSRRQRRGGRQRGRPPSGASGERARARGRVPGRRFRCSTARARRRRGSRRPGRPPRVIRSGGVRCPWKPSGNVRTRLGRPRAANRRTRGACACRTGRRATGVEACRARHDRAAPGAHRDPVRTGLRPSGRPTDGACAAAGSPPDRSEQGPLSRPGPGSAPGFSGVSDRARTTDQAASRPAETRAIVPPRPSPRSQNGFTDGARHVPTEDEPDTPPDTVNASATWPRAS